MSDRAVYTSVMSFLKAKNKTVLSPVWLSKAAKMKKKYIYLGNEVYKAPTKGTNSKEERDGSGLLLIRHMAGGDVNRDIN